MVSLSRKWSWKRWAPDLGENRELEADKRLYLELATGLTAEQLDEVKEKQGAVRTVSFTQPDLAGLDEAARHEALAKAAAQYHLEVRAVLVSALGPYVRVAGGPHVVDSQPLATLEDYFALVQGMADAGVRALGDLTAALRRFNSIEGPDELFSRRPSGGARTTGAQSAEKADETTAAR